jgi:hypothetical protein
MLIFSNKIPEGHMKWEALIITGIIVVSLFPVYIFYKYLEKKLRPRESGRRFIIWLLAELILVFTFTFLVVFVIKLIFPKA